MSALTAVDLFSGAGGTTQGLRDAGFTVLAAVENNPSAAETFAANHPDTWLLERDIGRVQAPAMARRLALRAQRLDVLTACPPCQPFSTLGTGDIDDPRNSLVSSVARFVSRLQPRAVILENVPGLRRETRFLKLLANLRQDYVVQQYIVQVSDFGIPQARRRIIALCLERTARKALPDDLVDALPAKFDAAPKNAGDALSLAVGLTTPEDPVHRARTPQAKTLERIRAVRPGGGRMELPADLRLDCHKRLKQRNATSIYGRIDPSLAAPTMTTRCTTPSCGRFIHPTEDRGLTLREAALLQSFPIDYVFRGSYGEIEGQIGNAVPPKLAHALGLIIAGLLNAKPSAGAYKLAQAA